MGERETIGASLFEQKPKEADAVSISWPPAGSRLLRLHFIAVSGVKIRAIMNDLSCCVAKSM